MEKIEENGITYVMGASTGDSGFDWQKSSNYFCANGREITISAREGGCTVSWVSDDGVERSKDLPADVTICGGSWDGEVSSSKITMTGGTVNGGLFGGGVTADSKVTGNVEINVLGGTLYDGVVGGGVCGSVGGNVAIGIGNAEGGPYIQDNVIGGGFMDSADVAGNVTVSINNGQIGTGSSSNTAIVTGGGVFGDVSGKVTVNVADGDVYAIVSGGSMISGDVNQSEINVSGGTVRCVSGGSIDYLMTGDAGSVKNVVINITDGEITNSVYGGSIRRGDIEESAVVNISGGTIGTDGEAEVIVAGSQIGDITGSATVNISNEGEAAPKINGAIKGADSILLNNKPVSLAVIYVDASATTSDIANGKIVGVNVFDSFITALKNVNADTTEIKISGDLTESATDENVAVVLSKDLTISGNVKWDSGKGWIQFKKDNGVDSVNLNFADFELSGAASNTKVFYFSDGVTATVDKDSSLEFYNGAIQPGATVKVENGGKFICLKEALQVQANGDKRATFIVEGEDTVAYTKYVNVSADANVTDSKFSANDYINVRDAGVFTADNSVVEIGTNESGVWYSNPVPNGLGRLQVSGTDSVFNLTNGSTLKASGNITNNGTINIEDSTFLANGTLVSDGVVLEAYNKGVVTNNGTINVSGESTLTIRELAGEAIKVLDGASLTDSVIGGAVDLVSGESNWSGKNTVTGIFSAGYNNYEKGDIETAITGEFTNTNFLTWNTEGAKTVVNIGEADGDRTAFNGGQIGIFERSEINIANADVTYNYAFIRSDFNVSDSTLTITNVNTYFSGAAHVTVENSTWTIGAYSCLGSYGYETADGSAVVTLLGNSTMNAGNLKLSATEGTDHNVSLNVEDATVNISSSLTVGAGAEVTLTEKSLINATGAAVTNNGSFAVNVTDGWSGIKTVIDGKAGTDSFGNVVIDSADAANGVKSYVDAEKAI